MPDPQGGRGLGLPQSGDQADDPLVVGRAPQLACRAFEEGERIAFGLESAGFAGYLHVDYFDAGGDVAHITPSPAAPLRRLGRGEAVAVGGTGAGGIGPQLAVAPPFGKDIVVALVTSEPLDIGPRPARESGIAYLEALRTAIASARAASLGFRGEWAYVFVETFPRGAAPDQ